MFAYEATLWPRTGTFSKLAYGIFQRVGSTSSLFRLKATLMLTGRGLRENCSAKKLTADTCLDIATNPAASSREVRARKKFSKSDLPVRLDSRPVWTRTDPYRPARTRPDALSLRRAVRRGIGHDFCEVAAVCLCVWGLRVEVSLSGLARRRTITQLPPPDTDVISSKILENHR